MNQTHNNFLNLHYKYEKRSILHPRNEIGVQECKLIIVYSHLLDIECRKWRGKGLWSTEERFGTLWKKEMVTEVCVQLSCIKLILMLLKEFPGLYIKLLASEVVLQHAPLNQTIYEQEEQLQVWCLGHELFFQ